MKHTKILKKISILVLATLLMGVSAAVNSAPSFKAHGLSSRALRLGLQAYECAAMKGKIKNPMLTIVDFTLPSTKTRLWVIDMSKQKVIYRLFVSHGMNSGELYAKHFSNVPGSLTSSLGAFIASSTYRGQHGYSLYLDGLEPGINDQARSRHIIVHGAPYVNKEFALTHKYMGRSWGCLALNPSKVAKVIDTIKGGSLIFAYGPGEDRDPYLKQCATTTL